MVYVVYTFYFYSGASKLAEQKKKEDVGKLVSSGTTCLGVAPHSHSFLGGLSTSTTDNFLAR